jgi:hypothetical protein
MKQLFLIAALFFGLTSCFKDKPTSEFSKVGGSWKIARVTIEDFDSLGVLLETTEFLERGYIMLTYNEGSLAENGFGYSFNTDDPVFNASTVIATALGNCNRWDVSVNAHHINFGYIDPNTQFTTLIVALSIEKLDSKNMHWTLIERNFDGSISRKETYELKRSN